MKIAADNTYVAFDYRLTLESGEEFDRSPEGSPLGIVTGTNSIIPGLEKALTRPEAAPTEAAASEPGGGS